MLIAGSLAHHFGDRRLFVDVSITAEPGRMYVVHGPSGCGKSTLLAILGGLLRPSAGSVVRTPPALAAIAWVLQGMDGLAARSTLDNAMMFAAVDGTTLVQARRAAADALGSVGLTDRPEARARSLSGGENQRLCVARALACDRPIVLADEPTSQLDRHNATRVMAALNDAALRRTVLVVTHDLDAVPEGAQRMRLGEHGLIDSGC